MLDRAWSDCSDKLFGRSDALQGCLEICNIGLDRFLPEILEWAAADRIVNTKIDSGEVFGKFGFVAGPDLEGWLSWLAFPLRDAPQALTRITGKVDFRQLAVIDQINPALDLLTDDIGHRGSDPVIECGRIIRIASVFRGQQCAHILRARQAAGVRGQDSLTAPFHDKPPMMRWSLSA